MLRAKRERSHQAYICIILQDSQENPVIFSILIGEFSPVSPWKWPKFLNVIFCHSERTPHPELPILRNLVSTSAVGKKNQMVRRPSFDHQLYPA